MNNPFATEKPRNRYHALRHGHSLANAQRIIISHPENGCAGFGLSEQGRQQVRHSLSQGHHLEADTIIISSDFRRARESAEIAHEILGCDSALSLDPGLRERHFGELEFLPDSAYAEVWREDALDPDSRPFGAESVNQVMERVVAVVARCESLHTAKTILLVSHGDALQILQTAFAALDGALHRQLDHLDTAEMRELVASPEN